MVIKCSPDKRLLQHRTNHQSSHSAWYNFCCSCREKKTIIGWRHVWSMDGSRTTGRQKRTWTRAVQKHCRTCKLNREDAMDCIRWKKLIRMVDDQDRCEWMNVSSGTGSPGSHEQRAVKQLLFLLLLLLLLLYHHITCKYYNIWLSDIKPMLKHEASVHHKTDRKMYVSITSIMDRLYSASSPEVTSWSISLPLVSLCTWMTAFEIGLPASFITRPLIPIWVCRQHSRQSVVDNEQYLKQETECCSYYSEAAQWTKQTQNT